MSRENRSYSRRNNRERPSERRRYPFPNGNNSPINQRRRSRSPLWDRESENQFHQRRHNHRNQSTNMTVDRLHQRHQSPDVPTGFTHPEVNQNLPDPDSMQSPLIHDEQREVHPTCTICQQQLQEGAEIFTTSCSHQFHEDCIIRWTEERDATCPICQERLPWYTKRVFPTRSYGTITLSVSDSLWASQGSLSIGFDNGEPAIQGLPGQVSPIHPKQESKTLMWISEPEEQLPQSSRRDQNPDRNNSGSVQTLPACNQHSGELPNCSICLLEMEEENKTSRLPCSHQFHNDCITRWIEQSTTCPLCRDRVTYYISYEFDLPNNERIGLLIPGLLTSLQPPVRMEFKCEAETLRIH